MKQSPPDRKEKYFDFSCDLCDSTSVIEVPYARKYTNNQPIHICKNCGLVYVKKRRSANRLGEVWSDQLFGKSYTSKTPLMLARHTYVAEFIKQRIGLKNKKLCDIGTGEGQFLKIVRKDYKASVFGIEPSLDNCMMMRSSGIKCFNGTMEDYLEKNGQHINYHADIATLLWTIENAASCKNVLLGARKILKEDGHLVIATGSRILVPFAKPLDFYLNAHPSDVHPVRFSANTLVSLLSLLGFKAVHINPYLNDSFVLCVIAKKAKINKNVRLKKDDFTKVCDFFKRWHKESANYL